MAAALSLSILFIFMFESRLPVEAKSKRCISTNQPTIITNQLVNKPINQRTEYGVPLSKCIVYLVGLCGFLYYIFAFAWNKRCGRPPLLS